MARNKLHRKTFYDQMLVVVYYSNQTLKKIIKTEINNRSEVYIIEFTKHGQN